MITVKCGLRNPKVTISFVKKTAQKILDMLDYSDYDLGIWLTTNKTIRYYNKTYRHKDKPTDILSFSYHPDLQAGERIQPTMEEDKNLGDLIISVEYTAKDANQLGISLEKRIERLLVHGICHLLGYDHEADHDFEIMEALEQKILKKIS